MTQRIARTCNVCEAMCGMMITVEGEGRDRRITSIRPDEDDVFSRGHICPKGPAMREVLEDPDRLRHPMKRTASGWQRISWDEAFDETCERLLAVQREHGKDAVGLYMGNPIVHNHGTALLATGFARALRSKNRFDANSQDANPKLYACMLMYGDATSITLPDVDRTDYMLMLGANPAASNGSLMTLGDVKGRLTGIVKRGGKLVIVDPRRTETAAWASEHLSIRPGADAAFLLALVHEILASGKVDEAALARTTRGLGDLRAAAAGYSADRVAAAVGIDAATIRRVAGELVAAKRAVVYGRVGTCTNPFGATASWLIEALNVLTGNFDREGGAMFSKPAVEISGLARKLVGNHYGRWRSRVRKLPELNGQLPASVMAEEMETPGPGQIRALATIAGNPVLSTANGERLSRAMAKLDFMVSVDFYINETSRHAHIILPPTHALEHGHYDIVFHTLQVRNTVKYSVPVVEPAEDTLEDWQILYELGMRLGGLTGSKVADGALKLAWRAGLRLPPDRLLDLLLRRSAYKGLSLGKLKKTPHGIDLGPLVPMRKDRVIHPEHRVELAPQAFLADVPRVATWLDEKAEGLVLIGRRHLRTNNSWMHNAHSLVKGPDRSQLMMNGKDAGRLGLTDGARVKVTSRVGAVEAVVAVTDAMREGVVSLPHGYGHHSIADTMRIAGPLPGPNINALTDELVVEPLTGTAVLNGVPVVVEKRAEKRAPEKPEKPPVETHA
jgi:anaerobic selenocysteine-containing dehydrogenase